MLQVGEPVLWSASLGSSGTESEGPCVYWNIGRMRFLERRQHPGWPADVASLCDAAACKGNPNVTSGILPACLGMRLDACGCSQELGVTLPAPGREWRGATRRSKTTDLAARSNTLACTVIDDTNAVTVTAQGCRVPSIAARNSPLHPSQSVLSPSRALLSLANEVGPDGG